MYVENVYVVEEIESIMDTCAFRQHSFDFTRYQQLAKARCWYPREIKLVLSERTGIHDRFAMCILHLSGVVGMCRHFDHLSYIR